MKALIILDLEDCTFDDIEQAGIKEITLEKKDGGCFLWDEGFQISYLPRYLEMSTKNWNNKLNTYREGWNACVDEILRGNI